jgi:flagellar L-ring protein precursor FlgH
MMLKGCVGIVAIVGLSSFGLAGCMSDIGREPYMTPIGAGLSPNADPSIAAFTPPVPPSAQSLFVESGATIYRQARASKVGDIVTVNIAINDQATLGNTTGRSMSAAATAQADWSLKYSGSSKNDLTSTSTYTGTGNIARSEQIQLSVATIVTAVLPNGNLLLSGSQEVRVNYELRLLTVGGIVRPSDINRNNTVPYDKIAEARISYGGRGRLDEVQQPAWGQQIYDRLRPF